MTTRTKGVFGKGRAAIGRGWMAFLLFGGATLIGGLTANYIITAVGLASTLGQLGVLAGFVVVYPVSYILYKYSAKRFIHQQVG